jgi:hypothetical protein
VATEKLLKIIIKEKRKISDDGLSSSFFITNLFRQKEKIKKPLLPKKAF